MLARSVQPYAAATRLRVSLDPGAWRMASSGADKLDVGTPAHLTNLTRFAVLCVFRPTTAALFGRCIAAKRSNIAPANNGWALSIGSAAGGVAVRWRRATTNLEYAGAQQGFLTLGQWTRLVVLFDQAATPIVRAWSDPGMVGSWREAVFGTATAGSGAYSTDAANNLVFGNLTGATNASLPADTTFVGIWPYVGQAPEQLLRMCEHPFPYERQALVCLYPGEQGGEFAPRDHSNYRVTVTPTNGQAVSGPLLCWRRAYHMLDADAKATAALTQIALTGGLTPTGGLVRQVTKGLVGGVSPAGDVVRRATKVLAGAITPSGALATLKVVMLTLAGALTPSGAVVRRATKALGGAVTPAGALVRTASKGLAGAITPAGTLVRSVTKLLSGSLTPSGAVSTIKVVILTLGGTLAPAGALVRRATKALGGGLAPVGAHVRAVTKVLTGGLTPSGSLTRRVTKILSGALTPVAALVTLAIVGGGVVMRLVAGIRVRPLYDAATRVLARWRGHPDIGPEA